MNGLALLLSNLLAWSLQAGLVALAAAALARALPVERPAVRLALWQALLALTLALPLVQPWRGQGVTVWWLDSRPVPSPSALVSLSSPTLPAPWPAWVATVLLAGTALSLRRFLLGLAQLRRLRRRARPLPDPTWLPAMRARLAPRAIVLLADTECSPSTFGLRRPVVLLPPSFNSLGSARQQAILMHELIHARRADWPVLAFEELLRAVLFFHPAVHWLVGRIRTAREQCVDAEVVRAVGDRRVYLESLVAAARLVALSRAVPAAPFLHQSHLRERVDLLLKEVLMSRSRTVVHLTLSAAAILACTAWAASAFPLHPFSLPSAGPAAADKATDPGQPKLVHKVDPTYPAGARAERVEGLFVIEAVIGKDGTVKRAQVSASTPDLARKDELQGTKGTPAALAGDPRLAEAALAAVKQWRWQPVLKDGAAVEATISVTVAFRLH